MGELDDGDFYLEKDFFDICKNVNTNLDDYETEEDVIQDIIRKQIEECGSILKDVKICVENKFFKPLSSIDNDYIEREYLKCCSDLWLTEAKKTIEEVIRDNDIQETINYLGSVHSLETIMEPCKQLKYYKLLTEHAELISDEKESDLIQQFTKMFRDKISDSYKSVRKEIHFLETLTNFLNKNGSSSKDVKLKLTDFCDDRSTFDEFLEFVRGLRANDADLKDLQGAAESLQYEKRYILVGIFKQVMTAYIKPTEIQEREIDDRLVVEVTGKNIVISEIAERLNNKLSENPNIDEVRFVGADIMHIDERFSKENWHGKNIVVFAKAVKIHGEVVWDVSGMDNEHKYDSNAGTDNDGHGKRGEDGFSGESGGNVLILTYEMENAQNFTIFSGGGKGSDGQNGGDGKNGKDGVSLNKQEFENLFTRIMHQPLKYTIKEDWKCKINWNKGNNEYKIFETTQGNKITISKSSFPSQGYYFYEGSPGQPGGYGGEYGLGGEGGYSGEITVKNPKNNNSFKTVNTTCNKGEEGKNGNGGLYGYHGKDGWDMYFATKQTWYVDIHTENCDSKFTLKYSDKSTNDSVKCIYHKKYVRAVARSNNKVLKKYEERRSTRESNQRQRHAQAVRKKNISQSSILTDYSHHLNSSERITLEDLQSKWENSQRQASQTIFENHEQQKKQTENIKIQRRFNLRSETKNNNDTIPTSRNNPGETIDVEGLIQSSSLDGWFRLKDVELSLSQIEELYSVFIKLKNNSVMRNSQLEDMENVLIEKYRIATCQEIAKKMQFPLNMMDETEPTSKNTIKYLAEKKENDNKISHPILGTLHKNLFNSEEGERVEIVEFLEDNENRKHTNWKSSMRAFITEVGSVENVENCIKEYKKIYDSLLEKEKNGFVVFPESYDNLDKVCCDDQEVFKVYLKHLKETKNTSQWYMNLLAHIFGINIKCYVRDQQNEISIKNDHNPESERIVHILCRNDQLIELGVDENHVKLDEERKRNDILHGKIIEYIKTLKEIEECDKYLKNFQHVTYEDSSRSTQNMHSDEDNIEEIARHFPDEERQQIKVRLEKIKFPYSEQYGVLNDIRTRFFCEGKHISFHELCFFINAILAHRIEDKDEKNTFRWIVSAYPQRNWIDEIILMQLEDYFKNLLTNKPELRKYLSQIENKDIILKLGAKLYTTNEVTIKCVQNILYLLSNITNDTINLGDLEVSEWPHVLKEKYWSNRLSRLIDWGDSEKLLTATYYILSAENIFGTDLIEDFLKILEKEKELTPELIKDILLNFHNEQWNLNQENLEKLKRVGVSPWIVMNKIPSASSASEKERNLTQLVELIKSNGNTSEEVKNILPKTENSVESISNEKYAINKKSVYKFTANDIKQWAKDRICSEDEETKKEMLAVIDRAIEIKRGFKLRHTQKLTILTLLTNDRSTLAQVSTGEGKSLIVVAVSIIKALFGQKVNIVTSSSVLAKRDAEDNKDLYNLFGINVSHNCSEDIDKRKQAYSNNRVVYGNLSNFQRDYLLDIFYNKNILGDTKFENVIVDEVDSMLLDKGNNILYLSHDLADLDKLESVYVFIWQCVNSPAEVCAFDKNAIREIVMNNMYTFVTKKDIGLLGAELNERQQTILWERLIEYGILTSGGMLIKENINSDNLERVLSPGFNIYKDRLNYLFKECIKIERCINVPNYLKPFVERHLDSWINSAINAFFMKTDRDYVVDVDRSGSSPDRSPNITILDRDTGMDETNSQWDEALHQFLQLKHGCKLSMQSLKAVFLSNVSFFKLYQRLYGLTGTLGSRIERDLLQEMYQVDFVTIPTAKPKQFQEDPPILCANRDEWVDRIRDKTKKITKEKKRSVLIICETINDAETLRKSFKNEGIQRVHTYVRDYEKLDVVESGKLKQGQIIIATNLAGRGTDIKITEGLRNAGGLHVLLTYLAGNIRIEQQAFGRAARCGDRGSGQLIFVDSAVRENSISKILSYKMERDRNESHRASHINAYYKNRITLEEHCFKKFTEQFKRLKDMLSDRIDLKEILLSCILDRWAFWLDENSKKIANLSGGVFDSLNCFFSELQGLSTKNLSAWVKGHPVQTIKLGKYYSGIEKYENALELFDEVIEKEPRFSEAAHYYKAFVLAKQINCEQRKKENEKEENKETYKMFKKHLRKSAKLFDEHRRFAINAAAIIGNIMKNNNESIIQIKAYEEQKDTFVEIYEEFIKSIDDILGHPVTAQSFNNINENNAQKLYDALLEKGILEKPKVKKNIPVEALEVISFGFGVSLQNIKEFLSSFEGKNIHEREFLKALKHKIKLPSREEFWKLLVEQEVYYEEIKYAIVENKKLRDFDKSLWTLLRKNVKDRKLVSQSLEYDNGQVVLCTELIQKQKSNIERIFKKTDFIKIIGIEQYKMLKQKGVLSRNKIARVNPDKIKRATFSCFDSISLKDFSNINISGNEAALILSELVQQGVLEKEKANDTYKLKIKYDAIAEIQLNNCPVYKNNVKALLSWCFTYRIALQKISDCLKGKKSSIDLVKFRKPHRDLFFELFEQKIIKPARVAKCSSKEWKNMKERMKTVLEGLNINEESIINEVVNTVKRSKNSLELSLKPLTEPGQLDFGKVEENCVFSLNGQDHLLCFEKKWTIRMLISTAIVGIFGIALCFQKISSLKKIGYDSLLFMVNAFTSGYFSWKDYKLYMVKHSIVNHTVAVIEFCYQKLTKLLNYGHKLVGPSFENISKKFTTETENMNKNDKRLLKKAAEEMAFIFTNMGIENEIINKLQELCVEISSKFLDHIVQGIQNYTFKNIEQAYQILGEKVAEKSIIALIKEIDCIDAFLTEVELITGNIIQEISKDFETKNNNFSLCVRMINNIDMCLKRVPITVIKLNMKDFLIDLDQRIKNISDEKLKRSKKSEQISHSDKICENIKKQMIDGYKATLHEKIMSQHIEKPIFYGVYDCLTTYAKRKMQGAIRPIQSNMEDGNFEKQKEEYEKMMHNCDGKTQQPEWITHIVKVYNQSLLKLALKTGNPDLHAALVRENAVFDITWVNRFTPVLYKILKERGFDVSSGLIIIVNADDDTRKTFPWKSDGKNGTMIGLKLKGGPDPFVFLHFI